MMIIALLPFAIGFESTRVATSVSLMRFTSLSAFIQVCVKLQQSIIYDYLCLLNGYHLITMHLSADGLPCISGWVYSFSHGVRRVPPGVLHLRPHP